MANPKRHRDPAASVARAEARLKAEFIPETEDRAGSLALTAQLYPTLDIREAPYAQWQYDANPGGSARSVLARKGGQVIGQYTVVPARFFYRGQTLSANVSMNTMVHQDYRGQGVFMILAEKVYAQSQRSGDLFTLGFPNQNSCEGFVRHLGFRMIGELPLWLQPISLEALKTSPQARAIPLLPTLLSFAAPLYRSYLRRRLKPSGPSRVSVNEVKTVGPEFNSLWASARESHGMLMVRDQSFLQWRYRQHPTRRYRIWAASVGEKLQGYLVTRVTEVNGIRSGMLVDALISPTDAEEVSQPLLQTALRTFEAEGVALAGCLMRAGTTFARALSLTGFWRCPQKFLPQPFPVIVRSHGESVPPAIFDLNAWYLTMGDYDAV